jgi:hypothetical protein
VARRSMVRQDTGEHSKQMGRGRDAGRPAPSAALHAQGGRLQMQSADKRFGGS